MYRRSVKSANNWYVKLLDTVVHCTLIIVVGWPKQGYVFNVIMMSCPTGLNAMNILMNMKAIFG